MKKMDWEKLVSITRLGREEDKDQASDDIRTEYMRDWDRLVYSSAFRRLQGKTQVFPLSGNDYVRTRLTHSIEVSSVGRSLGMLCGRFISQQEPGLSVDARDIASIVSAACLAHDIGNPPFGHSGETAIQSWFKKNEEQYLSGLNSCQRNDFLRFEGNAQGFRLITRLQGVHRGGLQLTYAVLAAFGKYPRPSQFPKSEKISEKKFGYCADDVDTFRKVAEGVGLISKDGAAYCRHPLAFLMEAADDICYRIVDLEDGHRLGRIQFEKARELLWTIAFPPCKAERNSYKEIDDKDEKIAYLRAKAIDNLIKAVVDVFKKHYEAIMSGNFEEELVKKCKFVSEFDAIKKISQSDIYTTPAVLQIEVAGFGILGGLLDKIVPALLAPEDSRTEEQKKIAALVPEKCKLKDKTAYQRLLGATDYISGMTDTFALSLFRRLHGMELPGGINP
jgi:dGTPase